MAARWGTGEERLTIGGMEFFAAGGRHQSRGPEEDEACDDLSELSLSSLDNGGLLGTFQGYIDNSIISILDDTGAQAEDSDLIDEEDELTLLTALTEILDNSDDENMSPFDTLPDTELLVSSKGRDASSMDARCSGPNWDLFPDSICPTSKRRKRKKSIGGCLLRRERRTEPSRQRSDGEDEEVLSPEKSPALLTFDKDFDSIETGAEIRDLERGRYLKHGTPCIINTENVTLHDLVKYMHPYCLPAITVCLEPEDRESLNDSVFLEIVSDQGECIKVPVVVEHPGDELSPESSEDNPPTPDISGELHMKTQLSPKSSLEHCDPGYDTNHGKHLSSKENAMDSMKGKECLNTVVPGLEDIATKPLTTHETVAVTLDNKSSTDCCNPDLQQMASDSQKNDVRVNHVPVAGQKKLRLKEKKSSKDDKLLNTTKSKVKNKQDSEDKTQDVPDTVTPQNTTQPAPSCLNNPGLLESDFLMKTLEQIKKDSQMEPRSSRVVRSKVRTRANLDSTHPVRKITADSCKDVSASVSKEQPSGIKEVADMDCALDENKAKFDIDQKSEPDVVSECAVSDETRGRDVVSTAREIHVKQTSSMEELSLSKSEDVKDCGSTPCTKDTKPKSVSLSEYRKRLQYRKPNPEQENENVSCSKWPSIPEPPTELAELPCLILPKKQNKSSVEEKRSVLSKVEESSSELNVPVSLESVPSNVAITSVCSQEALQPEPTEPVCSTIVDLIPPPVVASQPNAPPPVVASQPNAPPPVVASQPNAPPPVVASQPNAPPPVVASQPNAPPPVVASQPNAPPPVVASQPNAPPPVVASQPNAPPPVVASQPNAPPPVVASQPNAPPPVVASQPNAPPPVVASQPNAPPPVVASQPNAPPPVVAFQPNAPPPVVAFQPNAPPPVVAFQPNAPPPVVAFQPNAPPPVVAFQPNAPPPVVAFQPNAPPPVVAFQPNAPPPVVAFQPNAPPPVVAFQPNAPPPVVAFQPNAPPPVVAFQPNAPPPVVAFQPNAPPPVVASQPNAPPPFYPPNWPPVPSFPAFYPGMPPLPVVPQYPNCMPPIIPIHPPPPMLGWPSFPPPPIPVGPVHPTGWLSGLPPPCWSHPQVPPMVPDNRFMQSSAESFAPFSTASVNALPAEKVPKVTPLPSLEHNNPAVLAMDKTNRIPSQKPERSGIYTSESRVVETHESVERSKSTYNASSKVCPQVCPNLKGSDLQSSPSKAAERVQSKPPLDFLKAAVTAPDQQSANQPIFKIMEILKKAQKLGYQIKPPLVSSVSVPSTPAGGEKSLPVSTLKPAEPERTVLARVCTQEVPTPVAAKPFIVPIVKPEVDVVIPTNQCDTSNVAVEVNPVTAVILPTQSAQEPGLPSAADEVCPSPKSIQPALPVSSHGEPEESFTSDSGIVASDLSSLLEQFEKYVAKDEKCPSASPDTSAVGLSGSGKDVEEEIRDKHPEPELANTAGVTPPAAPSHPDCQPVISGPLLGKSKSLRGPARGCSSPLKTTKLIEAIPLPRGRLRNQNVSATHVALSPVHVASGEHDYCFLSASCRGQSPVTDGDAVTTVAPIPPAPCEEGSRWNVRHHQHITIKPIVQFSTQQKKAPAKLPVASAPSVPNPSTDCGLGKPEAPSKSIQKNSNAPLDHRIPATAESTGNSLQGSVLRSSDSMPYLSDRGESRTDVKRGNSCVSPRSLRCYRKYTSSPSPQRSTSSERSSHSSSGSSFSSSRSRSRSPPSKRRRYRSRNRHRSRSYSRSSYGTSSSSRSSSRSSSSSRSRSPYHKRYRSRRRRFQSRDRYDWEKNYRKERAIKERRVVYIGKISGRMTRAELSERFSVFGTVEDCTIHFREKGDNYGFVTYSCTEEAFAAIENGHKLRLPDELAFDLCFGGRRQFCKSNYADLDSSRDDFDPVPVRSKLETLDFETLLREAQKSHRR